MCPRRVYFHLVYMMCILNLKVQGNISMILHFPIRKMFFNKSTHFFLTLLTNLVNTENSTPKGWFLSMP